MPRELAFTPGTALSCLKEVEKADLQGTFGQGALPGMDRLGVCHSEETPVASYLLLCWEASLATCDIVVLGRKRVAVQRPQCWRLV